MRLLGVLCGLLLVFLVAFVALGGIGMVRVLAGPRLPARPSSLTPATDLAYLREVVLDNERGPTHTQFEQFKRLIDQGPPPQSEDELTLKASVALAAFDNAHSTLTEPRMHRLGIRVHWFADGLIIVKAAPESAPFVGHKILSIGGRSPEALLQAARALIGDGTAGWVRYRSEYFLTAPVALQLLGASVEGDRVPVELIDENGITTSALLAAEAEIVPGDTFREWENALPGDTHFKTEHWQTLLKVDRPLPLYQSEPSRLYLLRDLPEQDATYLRMNGSVDSKEETAAQFTKRTITTLREQPRKHILVDFRDNYGGSYNLSLPLVKAIVRSSAPEAHIYVIIGPNTFSAGLIAASQFKHLAGNRVTFVGDDVGDALRFRSEGFLVTLPSTHVEVYIPTAWDDVGKGCGLFDDCWLPNKFYLSGVGTLAPDIRVENTWLSYRGGHDLIVEAIFATINRDGSPSPR